MSNIDFVILYNVADSSYLDPLGNNTKELCRAGLFSAEDARVLCLPTSTGNDAKPSTRSIQLSEAFIALQRQMQWQQKTFKEAQTNFILGKKD